MQGEYVYLVQAHYGLDDMACDDRVGCYRTRRDAEKLEEKLCEFKQWYSDASKQRPPLPLEVTEDFEEYCRAEEEEQALWKLQVSAKLYQMGLDVLEGVIDIANVVEYNLDVYFSTQELKVLRGVA